MEPTGIIGRSAVTRRMRAAAFIMALAMVLSCLLFYFEDDINYAVSGLAAPALKKLTYSQTSTGYKAVLVWKAKKGRVYQVLRKTSSSGKYKVLASVKATSAKGKYADKTIGKNKTYTYTVRRVIMSGSKVKDTGKYDSEGLTTIKMPSLTVDFTNLRADLSWKKVSGVTHYLINRRVGKSDKFYKIRQFASKVASNEKEYSFSSGTKTYNYQDYYYYSTFKDKSKNYSKKLASIITLRLRKYFLDASNNPLSYNVQGYYSKKVNLVKKESFGLCLPDGEFRLEAPTIVSLSDDGVIRWGHVANSEGYRICSSADGKEWETVADVKSTGSDYMPVTDVPDDVSYSQIYQDYQIPDFDSSKYYTVKAFASKNGKTLYSSYDTGFTAGNRKYSENILFVGDSISYGSPYYDKERKIFSYQNRLQQLTGVSYFNPSIPGATYHYGVVDGAAAEEDTDDGTSKLVTGIMQMKVKGHYTDKLLTTNAGLNKEKLEDYDVVVLAGGTNDYLHYDKAKFKLGSREIDPDKIADSDKTKNLTFWVNYGTNYAQKYTESYDYDITTFDGAYNQIMKWIEEASVYRVQHGKKPIQVVPMSIFYSDRAKSPYYIPSNRDITQNSLGLTLTDYQKELDALNKAWAGSPAMRVFAYDTRAAGILDSSTCPYATADNLHLTRFTYSQYGNSLGYFMMENFLGKEEDADIESEEFIALAAKYGLLSERLSYLEGGASQGMSLQSTSDEDTIMEMQDYIRLLYSYGYLEQMLDECSPEDRERYERFIEYYDVLGMRQDEAEAADDQEAEQEEEYDPAEEDQAEQAEETEDASDAEDPAVISQDAAYYGDAEYDEGSAEEDEDSGDPEESSPEQGQ